MRANPKSASFATACSCVRAHQRTAQRRRATDVTSFGATSAIDSKKRLSTKNTFAERTSRCETGGNRACKCFNCVCRASRYDSVWQQSATTIRYRARNVKRDRTHGQPAHTRHARRSDLTQTLFGLLFFFFCFLHGSRTKSSRLPPSHSSITIAGNG